jgi:hypothetical protein
MRKSVLLWPLVVAALIGAGCLVPKGGLPGSSQGTGGEATSTTTTTTSGAGGAGGAGPSATASTGCAGTPEVCDNGVDDDCNGLADCADPACSAPTDAHACVAAAPPGWALTVVVPGMSPCPAGYDTPIVVAPAPPSAGNTCDCTCGAPNANPCTQGVLTVKIGGACSTNTVVSPVTGGCDVLGASPGSHQSAGGSPLPIVQMACASTATLPAAGASIPETMCAPTSSGAQGCAAGQACLPSAASASQCITASGDKACPAGPYSARSVVGTPGDLADERTCGACNCTSDAKTCSGAMFTAYTDNCLSSASTVAIDGSCYTLGVGAFNLDTHFIYKATPNVASCTPANPSPALAGQFEPLAPMTLCCLP